MRYKDIQNKFDKIIKYSQPIPQVNSDTLFENWLEAKRDFIEAFDGELIYEYPEKVAFELGPKEKELKISDFCDLLINKYENCRLSDFIYCNKKNFFNNLVLNDYKDEEITIPKGMKIIRAFKFFEKDKEILNELQSIASMILQEDKIEGKLCLSVHPIDFLSASENTHNWRSCHALDGEFRSGNLSYMVDKSTVMCYLKSEKEEILPNFPEDVKWNSKKWRVWLYFSQDWKMMFAGRQYPFTTSTGLDFVKDKLLPMKKLGGMWSSWLSKKISRLEENGVNFMADSPYIPINETLVPMNVLVENNPNSLQFNDLLSSSCYDPVYSFKMEDNYSNMTFGHFPKIRGRNAKFKIGGGVDCLCCNKEKIELSETFMCNDCEMTYGECESDIFDICPCCGSRFYADDGYWVEGADEYICQSCAENYTYVCDNCGDCYYEEDMIFDEDTNRVYCKYCYKDLKEELN